MNYQTISNRLKLRKPQSESLEILAKVAETIPLSKNQDSGKAMQSIKSLFPEAAAFEDFERNFPSLCFAIATGVGKTRLMGAFIAYLYTAKKIRHFFILAPNLTIHRKLVADFTPNTPKYVFEGINEFSINPPLILTGDNFDKISSFLADENTVQINIFNISKINSEERNIKKMSEYLGESYFQYLSGLDDLVLLMDEAHRYRAKAGMKAIEELNPILGLELTATPQLESGKSSIPFKNVIYNYPLYNAMEDGYVKEPAVATRENFDISRYTDADLLDRLMLTDGAHIHENVKAELYAYAKNNNKPVVKPFILVVCKDTKHADGVVDYIRSDEFFEGRYRDKTITVHSSLKGEEKDETVERLLAVENPDEPTEIVVHVNMLKEGWDVTNLYTIVPLRAANSRTLVEQSIGRGLRQPYGQRTGNPAVDRLTIVAHDKFDEIIREANSGQSIIKKGVIIGRDIPDKAKKAVEIAPIVETFIAETMTETEKPVVAATFQAIKELEELPSSKKLTDKEVKRKIVEKVTATLNTGSFAQMDRLLDNKDDDKEVAAVVDKVIEKFTLHTMDIPRVVVVPKAGSFNYRYKEFSLDTSKIRQYRPVATNILLEHLRTHDKTRITDVSMEYSQEEPQNYIISALLDFSNIDYERYSDLLYSLSVQAVKYLQSYLKEDELKNVLQYYSQQIAAEIYTQMKEHMELETPEYDYTITKGFTTPKPYTVTCAGDESPRGYRDEVDERRYIRGMIFTGFKKCIYPDQKFDSDTERLFSILLEDDPAVEKWVKPAHNDFHIYYRNGADEGQYHPDFVAETATGKYICEMKSSGQTQEDKVQAKAQAAEDWCLHATEHAKQNGGKPWYYVLIPHDKLRRNATLEVIAEKWETKI